MEMQYEEVGRLMNVVDPKDTMILLRKKNTCFKRTQVDIHFLA